MPRKNPTKKINLTGRLDKSPVQALGDYIESKNTERVFTLPPPDAPVGTVEQLWINNSREYDAVIAIQKNMFEESRRQQLKNTECESQMYETMDTLRERFIEVNNFLKDCNDKECKAKKVIDEEILKHAELNTQIATCRSSIEALTSFREKLLNTTKLYECYENILKDVVEISQIFVSPKDCIKRCDALMLSQLEINELQSRKIFEIELMRHRLIEKAQDAALTVIGIKHNLAKLQTDYDAARANCYKWEKALTNCKKDIVTNYVEKQNCLNVIHVIYRMLCKRLDMESQRKRTDVKPQLDFILREYNLLSEVVKQYEQQKERKSKCSRSKNSKLMRTKKNFKFKIPK